MWNINYLVISLSLVLHCQCGSKEVVKFGITNGTVLDLTNSTKTDASNMEECISQCEEKELCVLASQMNSTCYLHLYGYNIIINKTTGEEGQVAFKLRTDQPACGANLPLLLNTKTYYLFANHSEEYVYVIESSKDHYTIKFEKIPIVEVDTGCVDKNDGKEVIRMVIINATVHGAQIYNKTSMTDFKECAAQCEKSEFCMVASYLTYEGQSANMCFLHMHGSNVIVYKAPMAEGQAAFKLRTKEPVCGDKLAAALDKKTYFLHADHQAAFNYTIETRENWYRVISDPPIPVTRASNLDECLKYFKPGEFKKSFTSIAMVPVAAWVGSRWMQYLNHTYMQKEVKNVEECIAMCKADDGCHVATTYGGSDQCYLYQYNDIPVFRKAASYDEQKLWIKFPFAARNCELEPYELFNGLTNPVWYENPAAKYDYPPGTPMAFTGLMDSLYLGYSVIQRASTCYYQYQNKGGTCTHHLHPNHLIQNEAAASRLCAVRGAKLMSPWYANAEVDITGLPIDVWTKKNFSAEDLPRWGDYISWTSIKLKPECYDYEGKAECDGDKKWTSEDVKFAEYGKVSAAWAPGQPNMTGLEPANVCAVRSKMRIAGSTTIRACDSKFAASAYFCMTEPVEQVTDHMTILQNFT